MSFQSHGEVAEYDKTMYFGDHFSFPVLFDVNITGYDFTFVATETMGGSAVIEQDTADMTVVAGDPTSVQNSVTVDIDHTVTAVFDFDCLSYSFRWINTLGQPTTLIVGSIHGKDAQSSGS